MFPIREAVGIEGGLRNDFCGTYAGYSAGRSEKSTAGPSIFIGLLRANSL